MRAEQGHHALPGDMQRAGVPRGPRQDERALEEHDQAGREIAVCRPRAPHDLVALVRLASWEEVVDRAERGP